MTTTETSAARPPPLSRAATIPSRYYLDPGILEREKELVFGRTWQLVARTDELQRVGDFVPVTVLDEPIVITHGLDGELRGFYNVCRHRAGQVALTRGNRKSLQCRYHGWTYGLDGSLRACPEMEETEDFRKEDFGLVPVRVETWGPFVFVNLDASAPPLAEMMGAIPSEVAKAGYDVGNMRLVERRDYVIECNWKVYVDNYLEGYHLPIAHPQLFKELDYDSYRVEEFRYYSKQHAPIRELKPGEELGVDRRYLRQPGAEDSALYYWLFPNTMFNIYQDNMSSNVILPLGPDRTHRGHAGAAGRCPRWERRGPGRLRARPGGIDRARPLALRSESGRARLELRRGDGRRPARPAPSRTTARCQTRAGLRGRIRRASRRARRRRGR